MAERLATQAYVDAKFTGTGVLNGLPVNTIIRSTLPPSSTAFGTNWTYCDGKTLSKSDYPNLLGMYLIGNFSWIGQKMPYSSNYDSESFYAEDPSGNSQGIVSLINHHGSNYDYNLLYICQDSSIKMLSNETHYDHQRISICGNYIFATYGGYNDELYCKRMNKDGSGVTSSTVCADHGGEYSEVYSLNGKYFVFANGKIYQSSNGTSWTEAGSAPLYGLSNNWYVPLKYFNGKYFCFCGKYIQTNGRTDTRWDIYSTSDGINWTLSFSNLVVTGTNGVTMPEFVVAEGTLYALYPIQRETGGSILSSTLVFGRRIICTGDGIVWNLYGMTTEPVKRVIYNNGNFYGFDSSLRYVKRALLLTDIFSDFLDCSVDNFAGGTIRTKTGKLIVPSYTSTSNNYLTILAGTSNDTWDSQWIGANYKLDTSKITIPNITNSFIKIK